jgi:hypothetical protein
LGGGSAAQYAQHGNVHSAEDFPMKKRSILSCFVMACLALHLAAGSARPSAKDTTSGDGYVRFDARTSTWTLGTAMVEQRIELAKGVFALTGFENKLGHRQYVSEATRGEEFRVAETRACSRKEKSNWSSA